MEDRNLSLQYIQYYGYWWPVKAWNKGIMDHVIDLGPLLLTWISNHIHYKVWDEITYPFLNFNGATIEV